ncbi:MAG TPA: serine--tRNA ligase [Candidatus Peribacter riflensis]|uniref:Serine--tRNA ligase n=1 Tax=Candidatus Peribacter riflensis TaxID=1735162 RepID=A0A0S1SQM5_9BACT|nr:MAG: seryl-tRNA synthetase [Candidatus Peribacter riflensis]OGJ77956.1 MAG: serine--tRNA ligase [Candidatus Peribacteria bacterium RIFOXYB1_FULL_57_12]ALM11529.1 MAG: seryl-tRNA synthetase [Candidatus Peribacter riflensis]ALM12631.1 MAG: seryl-tRNA synthetase [Candidatus Peribacter riflensis]ALM13732.1 MAG: seryl-tRNA synthetase [Candidatus Peribacter riflensis]
MIDLVDLRARPDVYQDAADKKGIRISVKEFLKLDELRRALQKMTDEMRARQNSASKRIPGLKGKEKETSLKEMKELSEELKHRLNELQQTEETWMKLQLVLPSLPHPRVPVGKDEQGNVEVKKWGPSTGSGQADPKKLLKVKEPKDHVALGEALDIIDIPRGVKLAGARSYFLKGDGARLHRAVLQLALDHLGKKGWIHFTPPYMANWDCLMGTGFFPGAEEQTYAVGAQEKRGEKISPDDFYMIGTSEVSVCSYHKDEVLKENDLPKRYAGFSPCFRRESGTYGKDTKGLYRIHQFDKVEQVVLCPANVDIALALFEEIRTNAEEVLQLLNLPYRVLDICTGDMGKGKVYMQDIETWMPSREGYGETHSCSYLGDFQARRLNIKYETGEGKKLFVHTLNNTCIASPRILIPLLEMNQNEDGSITIPEALRPYMGGQEKIG